MEYKEKSEIIQYLINLSYRQRTLWMINEKNTDLLNEIESVLLRLGPEARQIINNDFIHKKDRNWYLDYYSRSTYYRLKNDAMNSFLNCLGLL